MALVALVFLNLQTPKNVVGKYLKSHVSEDPLTSNMLNGPKHFSNVNGRTFTIFIDPCEDNSG